ncbi:hypothetical protein ACN469_24395 [Corallococcus terminator]
MTPRNLLSSLPALLFALLVYAAPASAQLGLTDITCAGAVKQTWTPGLKLVPANVHYTNYTNYNLCTSTEPTITSGVMDMEATYFNSCLANIGGAELLVTWNDGSQSAFSVTGTGVNVAGNLQIFVSLGRVNSGRFAGDLVVLTNAYVSTQLAACLAPAGMTSLVGTSTLVITKVL